MQTFRWIIINSLLIGYLLLNDSYAQPQNQPFPIEQKTDYFLDMSEPIIFQLKSNLRNKSLFGWSLTFVKAGLSSNNLPNHWLFVGDPEGNVPGNPEESPGAVWKCSLSGSRVPECYIMNLDNEVCRRSSDCPGNPTNEYRTHMWAGGVIVSNANRFITCAPRWARGPQLEPLMNGACYWFNINSMYKWSLTNQRTDALQKSPRSEHRLMPFYLPRTTYVDLPRQYYQPSNSRDWYPDYAYGQAGISAYLDPRTNEALLGGPGVRVWDGVVIRYQDRGLTASNFVKDRLNRERNGNEFAFYLDVRNRFSVNYNYFGYAVTSGRFTKRNEPQYAGSSPRGSALRGEVTIFSFSTSYDTLDFTSDEIRLIGPHFGSYFGYSLLSLDVNGDGLDELFIGTPFYCDDEFKASNSIGDQGAVFIFSESIQKNRRRTLIESEDLIRLSSGLKNPSRFGSSMVSLGDLNEDGYNDLAIGAPFQNGHEGAVYIYYGKPNLNSASEWKYDQRISPSDIPGIKNQIPIGGFGCSFAMMDIDNNGTPDLGVGSYLSKTVVIFRSRPKLTILQKIGFSTINNVPVFQIDANTKQLFVTSCVKIEGIVLLAKNTILNLDVTFSMDVDQNPNGRFDVSDVEASSIPLGTGILKYTTQANAQDFVCKILHAVLNRRELGLPNSPQIPPVYFEQIAEYKGKEITADVDEVKFYQINGEGPTISVIGEGNINDAFSPTSPFPIKASYSQELIVNTDCRDVNHCESKLDVKTWFEEGDSSEHRTIISSTILEWNKKIGFYIQISNTGEPAYNPEIILELGEGEIPKFGFSSECRLERRKGESGSESQTRCLLSKKIERGTEKLIRIPVTLNGIYGSSSMKKISIITIVGTQNDMKSRKKSTSELELRIDSSIKLIGTIKQSPVYISDVFHQDYEITLHGRSPIDKLYFEFKFPNRYGAQSILEIEEPKTNNLICKGTFQKLISDESTDTQRPTMDGSGVDQSNVIQSRRRRDTRNPISKPKKPEKLTVLVADENTTYVGCNEDDGVGSSSISCETIVCEIFDVPAIFHGIIVFNMRMLIEPTTKLLKNKPQKTLLVESLGEARILGGSLLLESKSLAQSIVKLDLVGFKEPIPFWIYIVSGIGGLILLILITICLCKTGFFRRSKKEELQNLIHQTEVEAERRKTLMFVEQNTSMPPMPMSEFEQDIQKQDIDDEE